MLAVTLFQGKEAGGGMYVGSVHRGALPRPGASDAAGGSPSLVAPPGSVAHRPAGIRSTSPVFPRSK